MQVNPSNNQSTFKGAYKVPYTEEGAKLLRSKLNKNYNGAMDSIQLCLGNKTELQFLGIDTGIMVPDPVPLTTSLFSLAIANPKLIEGGNPNNVIKIMEGHHPDTNDFVRAVGFSLFQWVTKSEAKWLGLGRSKDYKWEHVNKLSEKRQEILKSKEIDISGIHQKDLYAFSGKDCLDYIKQYTQKHVDEIYDKVQAEREKGAISNSVKKIKKSYNKVSNKLSDFVADIMDRLKIKANFEKDALEPTWEKNIKEILNEDKKRTDEFNEFLSKREVKDVGTVEELIEILKKE